MKRAGYVTRWFAGYRHLAGFERLAQGIQCLRLEFRKLVEEQDAVVSQRNLTGSCAQSAADEGSHAGGVVRCAERPPVGQCAAFYLPRYGGNHGNLKQLGRREWRQNRRKPRRKHGFSGTRRTGHE